MIGSSQSFEHFLVSYVITAPHLFWSLPSYLFLRVLLQWHMLGVYFTVSVLFVYYESIKREINIKPIHECRCDERLQTKPKRFTRVSYTGLVVELEHLKIKTRLIDEKFESVKGECEI